MIRKVAMLLGLAAAMHWGRERLAHGPARFQRITEIIGPVVERRGAAHADSSYLDSEDYVLLFFSASWCGSCQEFTPQLQRFYQRYAHDHAVEVVLVSKDRTAEDMRRELREHHMPWAALPFDQADVRAKLASWYGGGGGIPNLVLLDRQGHEIASTYGTFGYESPFLPLQALQKRWALHDPPFTPAT